MPERPIEHVDIFDLTIPDDRQRFEDLKNETDTVITAQQEFALGTGAVYRIVDYKEKPKPDGAFDYTPPIC